MRIKAFRAALLCFLSLQVSAQNLDKPKPAILPLDQIHAGMKGTALTVFQGVKPESMGVEVLGVLRNINGPKSDVILASCSARSPNTPAWSRA